MQNIYAIIAELGLLFLAGFIYYSWQKKRIIRNDKLEIDDIIQQLVEDINHYSSTIDDLKIQESIKGFAKQINESNQNQSYQTLFDLLNNPINDLPQEILSDLKILSEKVFFHVGR